MDQENVTMYVQDTEKLMSQLNDVLNAYGDVVKALNKHHVFEENTAEITARQLHLLKDNTRGITKARIICYGRNGYGSIVEAGIKEGIAFEIIVCGSAAAKKFGTGEEDVRKIRACIKGWIDCAKGNLDLIKIYASKVPPSIRASVFYSEDDPIWGTVQSYQFVTSSENKIEDKESANENQTEESRRKVRTNKLYIQKPTKSLISVCDREISLSADFKRLISCFDMEFDRLYNESKQVDLTKSRITF